MSKKILMIVGSIVLVLAVGSGSFYGGMLFQQAQSTNIRNDFFANRGGDGGPSTGSGQAFGVGPGNFGGGGNSGGGGNFGGGNGNGPDGGRTFGQITRIEGDTITLSTPQGQNEIKVTLTDSTQIQKTVVGDAGDLKTGDTIVVAGERDSEGNVTAQTVQIAANP